MGDFEGGFLAGLIVSTLVFMVLLGTFILPVHTEYISQQIIKTGIFEHEKNDFFISGKVYRYNVTGNYQITKGESL